MTTIPQHTITLARLNILIEELTESAHKEEPWTAYIIERLCWIADRETDVITKEEAGNGL